MGGHAAEWIGDAESQTIDAEWRVRSVGDGRFTESRPRLLVAKGVHAPVAAYGEVCREFLRVNTPGVTTADLSRLQYHRHRPLHPFEA